MRDSRIGLIRVGEPLGVDLSEAFEIDERPRQRVRPLLIADRFPVLRAIERRERPVGLSRSRRLALSGGQLDAAVDQPLDVLDRVRRQQPAVGDAIGDPLIAPQAR